jgi:DNA-binding transcriptional ArsR family regulator
VLSALAAPRRQEILRLVWTGERCAGDIHRHMDDVSFGAVSQHLRRLHEAGLVRVRRDGRRRLYQANRGALGPLGAGLEAMWSQALWRLKIRAEMEEARRGPRRRRRRPRP